MSASDEQTQYLTVVKGSLERRIDSRLVAREIGVKHDNLMQTVRKYQSGLEKYGRLLFQTGVKSGPQRGKLPQFALLNREQFGYLLMFVRVTDHVRAFRERVYDAFLASEQKERAAPSQPAINTLWQERLQQFNHQTCIPPGYWSVFGFVAAYCWSQEWRNVQLGEHAIPDESVGKRWCAHLRKQGYDMSLIRKYPHRYPDRRGVQLANLYPDEWLGEFWLWFRREYLPQHFPRYQKSRAATSSLPAPGEHQAHTSIPGASQRPLLNGDQPGENREGDQT